MAKFERGDKVISWGRHKAMVLEVPDDVVIRVRYADGWASLSKPEQRGRLVKGSGGVS